MRFIDLTIAGLIAVSSIAMLLAWNPQAPDAEATLNIDEAHLRDLLTALIQKQGLVNLVQDSPGTLCGLLSSLSNSTVTYTAFDHGVSCGSAPPGAAYAELNATVGQKEVTLEIWYGAGP